ncbi:MAG TPA: peptide chain release factor N(5)-glutamine methyltransferase [Gemmatimonadaceae bacterium]|nr:peptide chain release factor N(5)-glutamine methyltransferase [Gemmatimonadaceae bacterium]
MPDKRAGSREPGAGSRKPRAGSGGPGAGNPIATLEERAGLLAQRQTVAALVLEVARVLASGTGPLARGFVGDASNRQAVELIAALLDVPRHWPLLRANKWVEGDVWRRAIAAARMHGAGAPLAYAVGRVNFRQLTLDVDDRVLIPRPETELLVDLVLQHTREGVAVDVGTGSGAIALSLAAEGNFQRVIATDVSLDALDVTRANAARLDIRVEVAHGDLLDAVTPLLVATAADVIVSNPPYIAFEEIADLPASVRDWEPTTALVSAENGLATTARLVRQAAGKLAGGGLLALEVDARRASLTAELVSRDERLENVTVHLDLSGRERFVLATRRSDR